MSRANTVSSSSFPSSYSFPVFSSAGLQVHPGAPSPSRVNVQGSGPEGPHPVTAVPSVSPRASSGLQLRPLQGNLPALRDTLLRLGVSGRPLRPAVPVQPRGAHEFRYNSTAWWTKWKLPPWAALTRWMDGWMTCA